MEREERDHEQLRGPHRPDLRLCHEHAQDVEHPHDHVLHPEEQQGSEHAPAHEQDACERDEVRDRKSTRLNSSHSQISYAVFCLKKKNQYRNTPRTRSGISWKCAISKASRIRPSSVKKAVRTMRMNQTYWWKGSVRSRKLHPIQR